MRTPHRRLALAGVLVAAITAVGLASQASAGGLNQVEDNRMVAVARSYYGTYQGECWVWVKKVVFEATGRQMGYGYRSGFLDAGAVEVPVHDARPGDIIQIIHDDHASPGVSYPGMHTAIVLENLGDGRFNIIDSNSQWDGVVRTRTNYSPAAAAARYGIHFHIYRIDGTSDADDESARGVDEPWLLTIDAGDLVRVQSDAGCVSLRASAGLAGIVVACIPDGMLLQGTGAPVKVAGRNWVPVSVGLTEGWVAAANVTTEPGGWPAEMNSLLRLFSLVPVIAFGQ